MSRADSRSGRRTATRDVDLHGRTIRRGDKVTIWYASANYDEEKFADPYRLDVGRGGCPQRLLAVGPRGPEVRDAHQAGVPAMAASTACCSSGESSISGSPWWSCLR